MGWRLECGGKGEVVEAPISSHAGRATHTHTLREWTRVTALEKTGLEPCNCAGCRKAPWKSEHNVVLAGGWEKGDNSLKSEDCVLVGGGDLRA